MKAWSWSGASADDVVAILRENWRELEGQLGSWSYFPGNNRHGERTVLAIRCHDEILMPETVKLWERLLGFRRDDSIITISLNTQREGAVH